MPPRARPSKGWPRPALQQRSGPGRARFWRTVRQLGTRAHIRITRKTSGGPPLIINLTYAAAETAPEAKRRANAGPLFAAHLLPGSAYRRTSVEQIPLWAGTTAHSFALQRKRAPETPAKEARPLAPTSPTLSVSLGDTDIDPVDEDLRSQDSQGEDTVARTGLAERDSGVLRPGRIDQIAISSEATPPPGGAQARFTREPFLDGYYPQRKVFVRRKQTVCYHTWWRILAGELRGHLRVTRGRGKCANKVQNFCFAASPCALRAKNLADHVAHLPADWRRYDALGITWSVEHIPLWRGTARLALRAPHPCNC